MSNKQIIYATPPSPAINPSLTNGTFKLTSTPIPPADQLSNDKLLVRAHYLSLDPAMRQWLTAKRSYIAPVEVGAVMRGQSIAQVLAVSNNLRSSYSPGDWVVAFSGWQEHAVLSPKDVQKIHTPAGARPSDALSVLGTTGLTAYFGMTDIGRPREGETVVVSGAAGATGLVAGQIARVLGAKRVVGIAGGKAKCEFLVRKGEDGGGFDAAVDYKDPDWRKKLKEVTPDYVDVFFDNVGGDILEAVLGRANRGARFVICGAISQYNSARPQGPASFMNVIVCACSSAPFCWLLANSDSRNASP
jgi:NADPH-dependent curcumin reductase CurA